MARKAWADAKREGERGEKEENTKKQGKKISWSFHLSMYFFESRPLHFHCKNGNKMSDKREQKEKQGEGDHRRGKRGGYRP